jgi:hypothetical protein
MYEWALAWLAEQRARGTKCLELKMIGSQVYVYNSTSVWDREKKRPKKVSTYLGKLDEAEGLIQGEKRKTAEKVRNVFEYGEPALIGAALDELLPLLRENFSEHWRELYALAAVRSSGAVPLKRASAVWERWYDLHDVRPDLDPKHLGRMLREIGVDREGQTAIFKHLAVDGEVLVYDLSMFHSQSDEISMAEKGHNKDHCQLPQVNLALLCDSANGRPTMIRALPGPVKDVRTIFNSIVEMDVKGKTLILDRGFFSAEVLKFLEAHDLRFLMAVWRSSILSKVRIHLTTPFEYQERIIRSGRRKQGSSWLYLYQDLKMEAEEKSTAYRKFLEKKTDRKELDESLQMAGNILLVSNIDDLPENVYRLYKKRDAVEKLFDTYKAVLRADRTYLQDDESVFGHVFVSFLSLYAYTGIEQRLWEADLTARLSPLDAIELFRKVFMVEQGNQSYLTEVPREVADLDIALKTGLFPKRPS